MNVYEIITSRILEKLEKGVVPWSQPWNAETDMPRNLSTKKPYRGINIWLLLGHGYTSPFWVSFKQSKRLGGSIKKGEKGTPVVFWKWLDEKNPEEPNPEGQGKPPQKRAPLLRYYRVFNVEQTTIPQEKLPVIENPSGTSFTPLEKCEKIVCEMPDKPAIHKGGAGAFYRPSRDLVTVPGPEAFKFAEEYYSTLFHELSHATGHPSRLDRKTITDIAPFGSPSYSREELIAEIGAAFLCGTAGIENVTIENSAAYIKGWLKVLESDNKMIVIASSRAQKAAEYILGDKP